MDSYGTQGPLETTRDHEPDHSLESSTALSPTKKEKDIRISTMSKYLTFYFLPMFKLSEIDCAWKLP